MQRTSLYRHYDATGALLYVGVSHTHLSRLKEHSRRSHWYWSIQRIEVEHFPCREDALMAEVRAIETEEPQWNLARPKPFRILYLAPGGDPSEMLAAFKSAQNVAHVRKSRAKPKKRKRKASTETLST